MTYGLYTKLPARDRLRILSKRGYLLGKLFSDDILTYQLNDFYVDLIFRRGQKAFQIKVYRTLN